MNNLYKEVAELIKSANYVIAFTGAGISVESGIPPFRGSQGLWNKYDPLEFAHIESFIKNPSKVWKMLKEMFAIIFEAKPNDSHLILAKLEKLGYLKSIITQNIDGLHQAAGSKKIIEYHGNCRWLICLKCKEKVPLNKKIIEKESYPLCAKCKSPLKPDVVFFGESIPLTAMKEAEEEAKNCDVMLVIGTSGVVYPASLLPHMAKSNKAIIVEINIEETPYTESITDYFLKGKASEILSKIYQNMSC